MTTTSPAPQDGGVRVDILIEAGDWPDVGARLRDAAATAWRHIGNGEGAAAAAVAAALTDDDGVRRLNREFRGKDAATNVLAFPAGAPVIPDGEGFLGDIAIGFGYVLRESTNERKTFEDHLVHLFIHGLLHLVGHDHQRPADAEAMESMERKILADMGIADPYADQALKGPKP